MISRSQMNRQLYNMGGEGIMQVAPQQDSMPSDMQGEQYRPVAENLANDPKQAIEVIVKMLMEQGIPEEEARRIAMEMIQTFAQTGSLEEFDNEERVEARFGGRMGYAGGGISNIAIARETLQSRAPEGEFLAYINPEEASILKSLGGAGRDINQTGIPSFFVKKIFKAAKSVVKGAAKAVKSVAKSPIGRIALTIGATYALGGLNVGAGFGTIGGAAFRAGLANLAVQAASGQKINFGEVLIAGGVGGVTAGLTQGTTGQGVDGGYGTDYQGEFIKTGVGNTTMPSDVSASIGDGGFTEPFRSSVSEQAASIGDGGFTEPFRSSVSTASTLGDTTRNIAQTSNGIMDTLKGYGTSVKDYVGGLYDKGIELVKEYPLTSLAVAGGTGAILGSQQIPERMPGESDAEYQARVAEYQSQYASNLRQNQSGLLPYSAKNPFYAYAANGGRIGYAYGSVDQGIMAAPQIANMMGMPVGNPRQNQQGVAELDYRDQGGFVPPIGVKERADDIPAMLSNNEFVFTADAVKNAGGGDPNVGAQKMYTLMKRLESGGMV